MNTPRFLAALLATAVLARAQLAPAPSPTATAAAPKDDVVQLSVFAVSAANDDEYRAANTTTGTRYNTPIKDLPMNIEVLTPSFMRDIGALDVRDALEYVSGIQLDSGGGAGTTKLNPENNLLLVRGIAAASNKDGFRRFVPMDPITTSRVDVIKGPGGALYGQGGTGGVINVSSVQAGDRPVARFGQSFGSFDYVRTEFLWSSPITRGGRIGFALPVSYSATKSNAKDYELNTFVMNPALTFKLGPRTTLLAALESRFNTRDSFFGSFILTDNGLAPDGQPYGVLIEGRPGTGRVLPLPQQRDFRFEGPDTFRQERTYVHTYRLDHRFSDRLQWWGGYNLEDITTRERSFNISLRNANDSSIPLRIRNDPRFLALLRPAPVGAQPQVLDIRPNNITNDANTLRPTWKTELYAAFDTGPVAHRLVTGISYGPLKSGNRAANQVFYYGNTGQPANPATQRWEAVPDDAILTRFRDPRDFTSVKRWDAAAIAQYPQGPEATIGTPAAFSTTYFWDRNLYANLQSSFFRDKLQTIIGLFDTRNDRGARVFDAGGRYLWTGVAPAGSPAGTPNGIRRPQPVTNTAPSYTVIWLPADWVRFYANSMSGIDVGPAYSAYNGDGQPLNGAVVRNGEAGLRFDLFQSKLLVNLVGFRMSDRERPVQFGAAIQNLPVNPATGNANGSGFGAFVKTTTESNGFDLKVDYVPLKNLRFNLGVSRNEVRITEIEPFSTPANPDPVRLAAQQRFVAAGGASSYYLGKPSTDISTYTGASFVRYEFTTGPLRNMWAMVAAKYLGSREAELISANTTTGDVTISVRTVPSRFIYDFNTGYRRKLGRYLTNVQLNVSNVLDDDKFYGAIWQTGLTYRLSAGLSF